MAELRVVGKSTALLDVLEKINGKAKFCSDFKLSGMLHAKILRSPYPHARIIGLDTSKAEKLSGVKAVITGKDVPPVSIALYVTDQYALCRDNIVRCVGDPVAAVAAETIEIAEEAVDLIEVHYEELPAVFDPEEAMKKDPATVIHPDLRKYSIADPHLPWYPDPERPNVCQTFKVRSGDVGKGFQEADLVVEGRYSVPRVHHCPLETSRADAWIEPDGSLAVRTSTQNAAQTVLGLAMLFNVPPSRVRVIAPYIGGGFGGKSGNWTMLEPIALLLAMKSERPVRLELTREEQFIDGRQRVSIITYIKDGVKRDGILVAREMKVIVDVGRHTNVSLVLVKSCAFGAVGSYRIPNFKIDTYGVYTSNPIAGPYRGFGSAEVIWGIEQQMDIIAERLGIDPVEVRKKNILREGDKDVCGQVTHSIGVDKCLDKVAEWIKWGDKPKEEVGPWRRGKGIAIGNKYTVGNTISVAFVRVHADGTIEVRHGTDEMGQGVNTVVAQIAAEEFGVSVDSIKVMRGDSAFCPYDFGAVSSRSTFHVGNAVRRACQDAKRRISEIAAGKLGVSITDLEIREGKVYVTGWPGKWLAIGDLFNPVGVPIEGGEILGTGSYHGRIILEDPETGQSDKMVMYYAHSAQAVEVAVNAETGEVKILRIAGAFDSVPINPSMAEAQIGGGIVQGLGTTLYEELVADAGVVLNPNFMDYKIPSSLGVRIKSQPISKEKILAALERRNAGGAKKGRDYA